MVILTNFICSFMLYLYKMSYFICRQAKAWKILQASLANYKLDIKYTQNKT